MNKGNAPREFQLRREGGGGIRFTHKRFTRCSLFKNKPGTAQVGVISKAQCYLRKNSAYCDFFFIVTQCRKIPKGFSPETSAKTNLPLKKNKNFQKVFGKKGA